MSEPTTEEWLSITDPEEFDEHGCLIHKSQFAATVRRLIGEGGLLRWRVAELQDEIDFLERSARGSDC